MPGLICTFHAFGRIGPDLQIQKSESFPCIFRAGGLKSHGVILQVIIISFPLCWTFDCRWRPLPNNLYVLSVQENSYSAAASMRTVGWCSKPAVYLGDPFVSCAYRRSWVIVLGASELNSWRLNHYGLLY